MARIAWFSALTSGCWAPEIASLPPEVAPPPNAPEPAPTPGAVPAPTPASRPTPPSAAAKPAAPPPPAAPPSLVATPESEVAAPPYTAWTAAAPLTPVGPGGSPALRLKRAGVRVEVAQVQAHRTRFQCAGCSGEDRGVEAWVQPERLRIAGTGGSADDALVVALQLRARWAGGTDLPPGSRREDLCRMIDEGFVWDGPERAVWGDGALVLGWNGTRWAPETIEAPARADGALGDVCRTAKPGGHRRR